MKKLKRNCRNKTIKIGCRNKVSLQLSISIIPTSFLLPKRSYKLIINQIQHLEMRLISKHQFLWEAALHTRVKELVVADRKREKTWENEKLTHMKRCSLTNLWMKNQWGHNSKFFIKRVRQISIMKILISQNSNREYKNIIVAQLKGFMSQTNFNNLSQGH